MAGALVAISATLCVAEEPPPPPPPPLGPVLLPDSAPIIQGLFERMKPALRYESVNIDRDHVVAKLCEGSSPQCFELRLDAASDGCAGWVTGPFCARLAASAPSSARAVIDEAVRKLERSPFPAPPPAPPRIHPRPHHIAFAGLGLVGVVVAALLTWRASPRALALARAAGVVASSVAAFTLFRSINAPPTSTAVFLPVADCIAFDHCFTLGQGSSVLLNNGGVWSEVVLGVHALGGGSIAVYSAIIASMIAGVLLVFSFAWRFASPAVATPAAMIAIALLGTHPFASPQLDTGGTFLFSALASVALILHAMGGGALPLAIAALSASHAFNAHVSAVVLLPAIVAIALLAGTSALRNAAIAALVFLGATAITSWEALATNMEVLRRAHLMSALGAAALVSIALGLALNRPFRRLSAPSRAGLATLLLIAPYGLGLVVLAYLHHMLRAEYLPPVIAPAALAVAAVPTWIARRFAPAGIATWIGFLASALVGLYLFVRVA